MKKINYRTLRTELDQVIDSLQQDNGGDIDKTIQLYERGEELVTILEDYLKTVENKITKLTAKNS